MHIINKNTGNVLNNVHLARTLFSKTIGLMFSREKSLLMAFNKPSRVSLHTWFVFFSLNVYYLNANGIVIERALMCPFSWYVPKEDAQYILEVPADWDFNVTNWDHLVLRTSMSRQSELWTYQW